MSEKDNEKYWAWIQACKDKDVDLNEWEQGFIDSLYIKLQKNSSYILSPAQKEHLERIYAEKTK